MEWSGFFRSRMTAVAGAALTVALGVVSGMVWAASASPKVGHVLVMPSGTSASGSERPVSEGMGPQPSAALSPSQRGLPSASAGASGSVPTSGGPSALPAGVAASFHPRRTWDTGMRADLTITNRGSSRVSFTVDFVLDPRVSLDGDAWNAQATYSTGRLRLTGAINPGETINAGFNLARPNKSVPLPQTCTVNGLNCSVVPE